MQGWGRTMMRRAHRSLGLEISDRILKLCELHETRERKAKIMYYDTCELAEGTIVDGRIQNREAFQQALADLVQLRNRKTSHIHLTVPSSLVMARTLQLPDIGVNELRKVIQYEMKNNLQVAFDNPHYDFIKLPPVASDHPDTEDELPDFGEGKAEDAAASEGKGHKKLSNVLVVAAPTAELNQYVDAVQAVKLKAVSIEIASLSLLRLFESLSIGQLGLHLVVNINRHSSEITIFEDGIFRMTRQIEVDIPRKGASLSESDEERKLGGLTWFDHLADPDPQYHQAVRELIAEIERIMDFYYYTIVNQRGHVFKQIWVTGDLEEMDEILQQMRQQYSVEVAPLEWKYLLVQEQEKSWSAAAYAVSLGLALRGGER